MEGASLQPTLFQCVQSGNRSFMLEISSLDDVPHSGRTVEVDRDQIETLTENNQLYTMQEIDDILK